MDKEGKIIIVINLFVSLYITTNCATDNSVVIITLEGGNKLRMHDLVNDATLQMMSSVHYVNKTLFS